METWKLRFSEHNFNCIVQAQFPTNFGIKCLNGRPWKNILSTGTRSHVTSCYGNYENILLNFVIWAIVDICFENFLPNLLDSILVVWSSKCWQLWIFFLKILVSMETRVLLFTYIGINDYRPIQRFKKRAKKTLGVVKCILVTMVTRSVAMETKVTLDWFLQIFPDLEIFVSDTCMLLCFSRPVAMETKCHAWLILTELSRFYFFFIDKDGYDQKNIF